MAREDHQPNDNCDRETEEENGWRFPISKVGGKFGPKPPHPKQTVKRSKKREQRERERAPSARHDQNANTDQLPDKNSDDKLEALGRSKGQAVRVVPAFIVDHDSQIQHGHREECGDAGVRREEAATAKDSKHFSLDQKQQCSKCGREDHDAHFFGEGYFARVIEVSTYSGSANRI